MAWHIDPQNGDIVIDGFDKGIADSPYDGIQDMRNINIQTVPGEVSVGYGITVSTLSGGGSSLGIPCSRATQFASGSATNYYILDANGRVWNASAFNGTWTFLSTSNSTTGSSSSDAIAFWKGYLFKFRSDSIDYYSGGTWVTGWNPATGGSGASGTITGTASHYALVGRDDVLYFCNGQSVGSIQEKAGQTFDPTNTAKFTFNTTALTLPSTDFTQCLEEQGFNLLIGGTQDAIYVWDRISPTFNNRIFLADRFIKRMVKANTNVFVFCGNVTGRGRVYVTNGSQADVFFKFPDHVSGYQEPYYIFYDAIYHRNNLIFGCDVVQNGNGNVINSPTAEIWAVDCTTKAFRGISDIPVGSASAHVLIADTSNNTTAGFSLMVGYSDGTNHGIGYSGTAAGTGTAIVKSDIIPVGTYLSKKTFKQIEFKLGAALASGESLILTPITDLGATSSAIATFAPSNTTVGNASAAGLGVEKAQWFQVQASMTGNSATSGCRLKEIRLR